MTFDRKVAGAALAKKHQCFIDGDAGEPGGKARLSLETFQMNESLLKGLLHSVFGVFRILKTAEGDVEHFLLVALEKGFERGAGATDGRGDKSLIRGTRAGENQVVFEGWLWGSAFGFELHSCISFGICRCCSSRIPERVSCRPGWREAPLLPRPSGGARTHLYDRRKSRLRDPPRTCDLHARSWWRAIFPAGPAPTRRKGAPARPISVQTACR